MRANWVLKPNEHLDAVLKNLEDEKKLEPIYVPFHHHVSYSVYISGALVVFVITFAAVCIHRKIKSPKIELVARSRNSNQVELREIN